MSYNLVQIKDRSEAIQEYIRTPSKASGPFAMRRADYKLDQATIKELKKHAKEAVVVAFSAEWCPDCYRNIPVLGLINEYTGLDVRVFGHLMRDAKSTTRRWAVPPSPIEVEVFCVTKIPLIVVLDSNGKKIGEIVENPPQGRSLEQALLDILEHM